MSLLRRIRITSQAARTLHARFNHDGFAALNIYKDAAKAPQEKVSIHATSNTTISANPAQPDDEYPSWLWTILEPGKTQEELQREVDRLYAEGGFDAVFANMPEKDIKRLLKLDNNGRIKESNSLRAGGQII